MDIATRTGSPDLSPGATKLVFTNEVLESDPGQPTAITHSRIYVVNADGRNFRPFFNGINSGTDQEFAPAWSADGTKVAYIGEKTLESAYDIYVADANGQTPPVKITNLGNSTIALAQVAWSPDGRKLAYSALQDIYVVNSDGSGSPINLTHTISGRENLDPSWSPDGQKIVFTANSADSSTPDGIYVMDADGQNPIFLHTDGVSPSWRHRTVTPQPTPTPTVTPLPSPEADLGVELSASPSAIAVGQNVTYTMIVKNNGPAAAANVQASLVRSASLHFVSASAAQGTCGSDANPLTCALGQLAAGSQTSIQFMMRATAPGQVVTFAAAASETADSNQSNNSQQLALTVGASCVPEVTAQIQKATLRLGNQSRKRLTHTIVLRNNSGRALNGLVHLVFDGLPGSIESADSRNAFSLTQCAPPAGRKYLSLRLRNMVWQPGQVITASVDFLNPQRVRVDYRLRIYTGPGMP